MNPHVESFVNRSAADLHYKRNSESIVMAVVKVKMNSSMPDRGHIRCQCDES
jgi:hypothetical protein